LGVPRNDDWSYLLSSFRFANGDGINGNNWALMNLVGQLVIALPINFFFVFTFDHLLGCWCASDRSAAAFNRMVTCCSRGRIRQLLHTSVGFASIIILLIACNSASFDGARWRAAGRVTAVISDPGGFDGGLEWMDYHAQREVFFSPERTSSNYSAWPKQKCRLR
jgi:hypothetical protein